MANVVVVTLSLSIGLFFILIGTIKLSPIINADVYKEMRKNFIRFTKVFPLVSITNWKPSPHVLRRVVGVLEVVGGLVLALVPGQMKQLANLSLLLSCLFVTYCHVMLHDPIEKMTSPIIFGLLLICRFIVRIQVNNREVRQAEEASKKTKYDEVQVGRGGHNGCHHHHHKGCSAQNAEVKKVK